MAITDTLVRRLTLGRRKKPEADVMQNGHVQSQPFLPPTPPIGPFNWSSHLRTYRRHTPAATTHLECPATEKRQSSLRRAVPLDGSRPATKKQLSFQEPERTCDKVRIRRAPAVSKCQSPVDRSRLQRPYVITEQDHDMTTTMTMRNKRNKKKKKEETIRRTSTEEKKPLSSTTESSSSSESSDSSDDLGFDLEKINSVKETAIDSWSSGEDDDKKHSNDDGSDADHKRLERSSTSSEVLFMPRRSRGVQSQAAEIVRTIGQAFEVCHKINQQRVDMGAADDAGGMTTLAGSSNSSPLTESGAKMLDHKEVHDDSKKTCDDVAQDIDQQQHQQQQQQQTIINGQAKQPQTPSVSEPPPPFAAAEAESMPTSLATLHQLQLLRAQMEYQSQAAQQALSQVKLLREQLSVENAARIDTMSQNQLLTNQNRELIQHIQILVKQIQELEVSSRYQSQHMLQETSLSPVRATHTPSVFDFPTGVTAGPPSSSSSAAAAATAAAVGSAATTGSHWLQVMHSGGGPGAVGGGGSPSGGSSPRPPASPANAGQSPLLPDIGSLRLDERSLTAGLQQSLPSAVYHHHHHHTGQPPHVVVPPVSTSCAGPVQPPVMPPSSQSSPLWPSQSSSSAAAAAAAAMLMAATHTGSPLSSLPAPLNGYGALSAGLGGGAGVAGAPSPFVRQYSLPLPGCKSSFPIHLPKADFTKLSIRESAAPIGGVGAGSSGFDGLTSGSSMMTTTTSSMVPISGCPATVSTNPTSTTGLSPTVGTFMSGRGRLPFVVTATGSLTSTTAATTISSTAATGTTDQQLGQ